MFGSYLLVENQDLVRKKRLFYILSNGEFQNEL